MALLEGKVVLITGGARGQGRAHAVVSASEGADVILVDALEQIATAPYPLANKEDLEETVRQVEAIGRRALPVVGDVRSQADMDDAVERGITEFGHIDSLIANAAIMANGALWELTEEQWQDIVDVNLTGVWHSLKAVVPHMIERQSGSIVLISSVAGIEPGKNYAHYTAAKHGVVGLMRATALELAEYGIRCNSVHPGTIDTPMTNIPSKWARHAGHEGGTQAEWYEDGLRFNTLKGTTFMDPKVIANAALYLNSELAAKVTGVMLPVDGGHLLMPGINANPTR